MRIRADHATAQASQIAEPMAIASSTDIASGEGAISAGDARTNVQVLKSAGCGVMTATTPF
jgi:hypothetical protein